MKLSVQSDAYDRWKRRRYERALAVERATGPWKCPGCGRRYNHRTNCVGNLMKLHDGHPVGGTGPYPTTKYAVPTIYDPVAR
jgi:hypothetical protein